jgi:hypothetical protein
MSQELDLSIPDGFIFTEVEFNNLQISEHHKHNSSIASVARRSSIHPTRVKPIRSKRVYRNVKQRKIDSMSKRIH